jgi:hypothetical protein
LLRPEPAVQYKRIVKRVLISALRTVFSEQYPDPQLANLFVSTTNPLKRENFPAVIVRFNENFVKNAGVSHQEMILNDNNFNQSSRHFYFEGGIQFVLYALSPLDLDVLSDSLIELLAFGRLNSLTDKFFSKVYNDIEDGYQFSIASDQITASGESVTQPVWFPEDMLLYQSSYTVKCHGAFYSLLDKGTVSGYVDEILAYGNESYQKEEELLFHTVGNYNPQTGYIRGRALISSIEDYFDFPI